MLIPLAVFVAAVFITAAGAVVVSALLGWSRRGKYKDLPYESGIPPTGDARIRMAVPYYLVAIMFILFDVEILILYPYAAAMRGLAWDGFAKALVFILFVFAGLVYVWLRGGLIWRHRSGPGSAKTSSSAS